MHTANFDEELLYVDLLPVHLLVLGLDASLQVWTSVQNLSAKLFGLFFVYKFADHSCDAFKVQCLLSDRPLSLPSVQSSFEPEKLGIDD